MSNEWITKHLEKSTQPNEVFKDVFDHFANTKTGKQIVSIVSQRISIVLPSFNEISMAAVEHPEQFSDPGKKKVTGLTFQVMSNPDEDYHLMSSLFVAEGGKTAPCFNYDYWKELGHISFGQMNLYHEHNTSTWGADEYILDDVKEEHLDLMRGLNNCVIQITDNSWILCDENFESFYYINNRLVPTLLTTNSISEIFLRLLFGNVFRQSIENVLSKDFNFEQCANEHQHAIDPQKIDLEDCDLINDVDSLWVKCLRKDITSLDLSRNNLPVLPDEMKEFKDLEELTLYSNNLTSLPAWISSFKKLKTLNIGSNPITELPENIGDLSELINFEAIGSKLTTLPASFSKLKKLQEINFYRNNLTDLPSSCSELPELTFLELSYNKITSLDHPVKFEKLEKLYIESNPVTKIHDSFFSDSLTSLKVKFTELGFPKAIANSKNLESLDIVASKATEIPPDIFSLQHLSFINLTNNEIQTLPEAIFDMPSLGYLNVSNNNITMIPDLKKATQLRSFHASKNKINSYAEGLELPDSLKEVSLYENNLTNFQCKFSETSNLQYINLQDNPFTESALELLAKNPKIFRLK